MGGIFDLDAPIWVWMSEVADVIIVSLLWWACSTPIITVGASTSALFYVLGKKVRKESVYVAKDFFKSFKQNFKQSLPISILMLIALTSAGLYVFMIVEGILSGDSSTAMKWIIPVGVLFGFETINVFTYVWALLSRFDMKSKQLLKTALVLVHKHIFTTFLITGIFGISIYLVLRMPFLIVVLPGMIVGLSSFLLQPLFTRYIEAGMTEA